MADYDTNIWIYEYDNNNRYILGTKGVNPIICIGINPSTASPNKLDRTIKSLIRIAKHDNKFDSWIMLNLYPQKETKPKNLHLSIDESIHRKNLKYFEKYILKNNFAILAAWGTNIEKRVYLKDCLIDIYDITKNSTNWLTIGVNTKKGHPRHPLYCKQDEILNKFHIEEYIKKIKL